MKKGKKVLQRAGTKKTNAAREPTPAFYFAVSDSIRMPKVLKEQSLKQSSSHNNFLFYVFIGFILQIREGKN
jgi:hypothetical protein